VVRGVKDLRRAIVGGNVQDAENQAESLVQEGMTGREVFDSVVRPAMEGVVAQFGRREVYMPELLISLRAAGVALRRAKETWGKNQASSGRVVVGSISPDCQRFCRQVIVHLLEAVGYEGIDLGASVPTRTRILWVGFGMENSPCGDRSPDAACDDLAEIPGLVRQLTQRN